MKCPSCRSNKTKVIDSRSIEGGSAIRRRRLCEKCGTRFTTFERRGIYQVAVIKKDGRKVPYSREKLALGFYKACSKRDVPSEVIEKSVNEIEEEITSCPELEIKASAIGDMVMKKLRQIDEVAYMRFASVYKRFDDLSEFEKELGQLMNSSEENEKEDKEMERSD
ncbi:MAG: transcriptional regulator NrdR [Actinomycetota bacterium]|nr:transcriptional regulator NrdR [Actinomycetota bacterium]